MDNRLVLTDYTSVPEEERDFCRAIQREIDRGNFDVLVPEFLKKDEDGNCPQVFRAYQNDYQTGKYAGVLYYKGRTVVIHSRFDGADGNNHFLNYALAVAGKLPMKILRTMDETASRGGFDLILAQLFLSQLRDAYGVGVYREYRTFACNDASPKGRLDISRHIRLNPLSNGKIAYSTREYTQDNPVNHLILAAWGCLCTRPGTAAFAKQLVQADPALKRPLDELEWTLGQEDISRPALNRVAGKAARPITHPLHQRYEAVRRTALLILRETGLDLFRTDGLQVGGVLIPMDKTWEKLLEYAVLSEVGGVSAQKEIDVLLKENGSGMRTFVPDFLLNCERKAGRITARAVADAKYRRAWEKACQNQSGSWPAGVRDDVFQVLSYMYVTGAAAGAVLCPLPESKSKYLPHHSYPLCAGMKEQFRLIALKIPDEPGLERREFHERMGANCRQCAQEVRKLLEM